MSEAKRNVRVQFWLPVILGSVLAAILVPWVDGLLPDVLWWPVAWPVCFALTSFALILWFTRGRSRRQN